MNVDGGILFIKFHDISKRLTILLFLTLSSMTYSQADSVYFSVDEDIQFEEYRDLEYYHNRRDSILYLLEYKCFCEELVIEIEDYFRGPIRMYFEKPVDGIMSLYKVVFDIRKQQLQNKVEKYKKIVVLLIVNEEGYICCGRILNGRKNAVTQEIFNRLQKIRLIPAKRFSGEPMLGYITISFYSIP